MFNAIIGFFSGLPRLIDLIEKGIAILNKQADDKKQDEQDDIKIAQSDKDIDRAFDTDDEELLNEISDS